MTRDNNPAKQRIFRPPNRRKEKARQGHLVGSLPWGYARDPDTKLAKLIHCERCGARMHGCHTGREGMRRYQCSTRRHHGDCEQTMTLAQPLEEPPLTADRARRVRREQA